ncbi:MAG: hypothetical protein NC048_02680 [Bacteroides sp.]|nr:hypothetical protein [Bacteroides sp.]MCM1531455.1 hypothetical protein [Ruminococcus flavefaciens]MCM1554383.1 hypothetical protein [Bacteroides sp.]
MKRVRYIKLPILKKSSLRKGISDYMSQKSNKQQLYIVCGFLFVLLACSVLSILSTFI